MSRTASRFSAVTTLSSFLNATEQQAHRIRHARVQLLLTLALALVLTLSCSAAGQSQRQSGPSGRTRTYYLAADEIDWDYAPSGMNQINGEKYHFQDDPASKGMLNPNATVYRKVVFREYTDPSFHALKTRPEHWTHLGILGPLIRAEVGDTIRVVFKNNGSRPYSVHPHGVFYSKDSEGAAYQDNTSGKDRADDAVAPGATYRMSFRFRAASKAASRDP